MKKRVNHAPTETQRRFVAEKSMRLDLFLRTVLGEGSRQEIKALCGAEKVLVNGAPARGGASVKTGDTVELLDFPHRVAARPELAAEAGGALRFLRVVYEDSFFLAVSKPRAMSSVTLGRDDPLTAADCLADYCPACRTASPDAREAGLVQRLDFYTSGVMLAAKQLSVWHKLRHALREGRIEKEYLCLIEGKLHETPCVIDLPLLQTKSGRSMVVAPEASAGAFAARTEASVERCFRAGDNVFATLVRARAARARRHQIRVHLAAIGHPLVGDRQYGTVLSLAEFAERRLRTTAIGEGFLLHAERITLPHPETGEEVRIVDPISSVADELLSERR